MISTEPVNYCGICTHYGFLYLLCGYLTDTKTYVHKSSYHYSSHIVQGKEWCDHLKEVDA